MSGYPEAGKGCRLGTPCIYSRISRLLFGRLLPGRANDSRRGNWLNQPIGTERSSRRWKGSERKHRSMSKLMNDNLGFQPTRSLKQQFSRPSEVWKEHAEPVFRFWTAGDCWAFPFFSLDSRCQRSEGSWISMLRFALIEQPHSNRTAEILSQ